MTPVRVSLCRAYAHAFRRPLPFIPHSLPTTFVIQTSIAMALSPLDAPLQLRIEVLIIVFSVLAQAIPPHQCFTLALVCRRLSVAVIPHLWTSISCIEPFLPLFTTDLRFKSYRSSNPINHFSSMMYKPFATVTNLRADIAFAEYVSRHHTRPYLLASFFLFHRAIHAFIATTTTKPFLLLDSLITRALYSP